MQAWLPYAAFVLALLGILWKTSALTTRLELANEALAKEIAALKEERKHLGIIPGLAQRVEQLEEVVTELTSTLRGKGQDDGLVARVRSVEKKLSVPQMSAVRDPRREST